MLKDNMKVQVEALLYGFGKKEVSCIAETSKPYVGMESCIRSKARPKKARDPRLNGLIVVLDNLFKNQIASIVGETFSVTEYQYNGNDVISTFNGSELSFLGEEIPNGYEILTPIVVWAFSEDCTAPEFKERMADAINSYIENGAISLAQAYGLCDSFYYEVCSQCDEEIKLFTNDVIPQTFKQGYIAEVLYDIDTFNKLSCPKLSFLE